MEETAVAVVPERLMTFTEDIMYRESKHYITHYVWCRYESGDPTVVEPDKFQEVRWVSHDELWQYFHRGQLFSPLAHLLGREFDLFAP